MEPVRAGEVRKLQEHHVCPQRTVTKTPCNAAAHTCSEGFEFEVLRAAAEGRTTSTSISGQFFQTGNPFPVRTFGSRDGKPAASGWADDMTDRVLMEIYTKACPLAARTRAPCAQAGDLKSPARSSAASPWFCALKSAAPVATNPASRSSAPLRRLRFGTSTSPALSRTFTRVWQS